MTFEDLQNQIIEMLQRQGRVSYRALKRQFNLDDAYLEDLVYEIVEVHKVAVDKDDAILVWTGKPGIPSTPLPPTGSRPDSITGGAPEMPPQSTPAHPEAERRHLTVMFCDLVGSTELSEKLDPEDLREILHAYHEVTETAIASFEGHIAKYLGDGLLIYFGYPQAHEDDAVRAARSGLRILEAVKHLNPQLEKRWGVTVGIRMGIHTGLVVAGEMGVGDVREPMAIVGETPNVAARLQGLAAPDTVVISAATYQLVSRYFDCSSLGSHSVKGIVEPIAVYQVVHENTARARFDSAEESTLTPLMGRAQEIEALFKYWQEANAGHSNVVLLSGEAGIGKSRLVWELKKHISQEKSGWLTECHASPYYRNTAFYPIIDLLERVVLEFGRSDAQEDKLAKIEGLLIEYGLPLSTNVPLFASLLSVPYESKFPPVALSPERLRQKTIEALASIILTRAAQQTVLLVMEDLHWMDVSTLDFITLLIQKEPTYRLLILLTCRPEFVPPWGAHPHFLSLPLKNLPRRQTQAIVEQMAGMKSLPKEVVQQIVEKTDGIPLFVEELTKTVIESGLLEEKGGQYELSGPIPPLAIPATLHDSLIARLDRLAVVKEIAQLGACLGREFDFDLIQAVSPWKLPILQEGLEQLTQAELLYQHGTPPTATYKFKHALIQDTAYQSLLKTRRQQYHLRIAHALEERFPETVSTQPELLAHHYTQAGLEAQAVPYWHRAGQRALARVSNLDAIAHLSLGLKLLKSLPENRDRDNQELEMQLCLAPAVMAIKGWAAEEVEIACRRARNLSESLGDGQRLATALWGLWTNYFLRGQMDEALHTARETLRVALETDNPRLYAPAHHAVGYTHFYRGEYEQALKFARQGISRFDLDMERELVVNLQISSIVCLRIFLAGSLWMLGYPDQAPAQVDEAMALSNQLNHLPNKAYMLATSCLHYQPVGNVSWVEEKSAELIALCQEANFLLWHAVGIMYHGWARSAKGDYEGGIAEALEGLAMFKSTGTAIILPQFMTLLGEMLCLAGRTEEALSAIEEGMQEVARRNEHHMEPELYRVKAEILRKRAAAQGNAAQGNEETGASLSPEIEACFHRALHLAREQNARMLELRATVGLCRYWQSLQRREEAYSLLSNVYSAFTEGWDTPDLENARMLLKSLEEMTPSE